MLEKELSSSDFAPFFKAMWGFDPFPWQQQLLHRLADSDEPGCWPEVLDLPTGTGKTATLDIAVFHLALEAAAGAKRRAPLRIAFIVDRRLIVDDAYERSKKMALVLKEALRAPHTTNPVVLKVAQALCTLAGTGHQPLVVRRLRGGAPLEEDWALTPVQPTILCSTVDQVGSRLLFRGYGVSDRMKPIHAGLLGSDCLLLLDEAHLSEPFRQTLAAIRQFRAPDSSPFGFALLTATPGVDSEKQFGLSAEDHSHPVLVARISATKPANLIEISAKQGVDGEKRRIEEAIAATKAILGALENNGIARPVIGVVLNRVARARAVFDQLRQDLADADTLLLIGPARSAERDILAARLASIRTGNDEARTQLKKPLIVVATQTIEAGVDLDFDGLVTEAAALDALRQRFGRLNREGRPITPEATVLAYKGDLGPKADDIIYGDRISATWVTLQRLAADTGAVDFGIEALNARTSPSEARELAAPTDKAPILMPAYAELWSQTWPVPNADPEVALFLHGPDRSPASVQIVWRADISQGDLRAGDERGSVGLLEERLKVMPPRSSEAVEVSLWAARAWLQKTDLRQTNLSDVAERRSEGDEARGISRYVFRWAGEDSERTGVVGARELRNGDLIVVPTDYGGCDEWGWNPQSAELVNDIADMAQWPFRSRRFVVRLTPELIVQGLRQGSSTDEQPDATPSRQTIDLEAISVDLATILDKHGGDGAARLLDAVSELRLPHELRSRLEALGGRKGRLEVEYPYALDGEDRPRGVAFIAPRGLETRSENELAGVPSTESEDAGSIADQPVPLIVHSRDVRRWAEQFAALAGLERGVAADLALAAFLHDAGKADPRYQSYFSGGDPYGPAASEVLAKSGQRHPTRGAWRRAGLPTNWRHEALSVRLALIHSDFKKAHDPELVLWLIGTHHGFGRPLFPHSDPEDTASRPDLLKAFKVDEVLPPGPGPQSLAFDFGGLDWAQLFEGLKRRYGIWGLARLEGFVRLADHRASEQGSSGVDDVRQEAAE